MKKETIKETIAIAMIVFGVFMRGWMLSIFFVGALMLLTVKPEKHD